MELPTYTNIWKIEKRLYKLYDFRLPMPLPVGQAAAFLAIAIPYMLALTLVGMPFGHTWVWLYVLPPGAVAWLVTRPVIEGKRLPELVVSQVRYLTEPRTWCRLAPLTEDDHIAVVARVWRASPRPGLGAAAESDEMPTAQAPSPATRQPVWPERPAVRAHLRVPPVSGPVNVQAPAAAVAPPVARESALAAVTMPADRDSVDAAGASTADTEIAPNLERASHAIAEPAAGDESAAGRGDESAAVDADELAAADGDELAAVDADELAAGHGDETPAADADELAAAHGDETPAADADELAAAHGDELAAGHGDELAGAEADEPATATSRALESAPVAPAAGSALSPAVRPVLRVRADEDSGRPLHVVERALRTSRAGWRDRVVVVPGGHRPGTPDHAQRDQARARRELAGPARIVVLGTTAGAGQTVTTLLTGQLLASLRGESVAVLDFGGRPGSLTELARQIRRLLPSRLAVGQPAGDRAGPDGEPGLQVVTADHSGPGPRDADRLIDAIAARYSITLADPAPADVPRALQVADQLVLVTPAGASSAGSLGMTLEWLEAHGHARLAQTSVTLLNGVSKQTAEDAERATTVAAGRCRAIVRVPWDASLSGTGQLSTVTVHAYTALAGVLVSGLADAALAGSAGSASP